MAAGDYVVRRNNANTDTLPNTGGGDLLLLWDTAVANVGAGITYSAGIFTLGETGLFLVLCSDQAGSSDTATSRCNWKTTFTLAGTELKAGYCTGFLRKTGGAHEAITQSCAIINVTTITGNGDELQVRSERTDITTPSPAVARIADRSGITIIKLDDAHNFARYESSALFSASATDNARVLANLQTTLLQESPFTRTTDTIDIATGNKVLAIYTMQVEERTGDTGREEYQANLELAGTSVPGSWNMLYLRHDQDSDWAAKCGVCLLRPTSGDDLTLGLISREGSVARTFQATLELWELPSGAETAIMEATTGDFNTAATNFAWDTLPQIDTAAFTATAGNSNVDVDNAGDYLVATSQAVASDAIAAALRAVPATSFRINAVDQEMAGGSSYNRNTGTSGHASITVGTLLTGLSANDSVHVHNDRIGTATTAIANSAGAFSIIRLSSLFGGTTTPKTIAATAVGIAVVSLIELSLVAIAAVSTGLATFSKTVGKPIAVSAVGLAAFVRKVAKAIAASNSGIASTAITVGKTIAVASTGIVSRAHQVAKTIAGTAMGVAVVLEVLPGIKVTIAAISTGAVTLQRKISLALSFIALAVPFVARGTFGKILTWIWTLTPRVGQDIEVKPQANAETKINPEG